MTTKKTYIKRDNSKQTLRGFSWNKSGTTIFPNFSFDAVLQLIDKDPVARGALNHFVDKCMEGDYSIVKKKDRKYDRDAELRLEEQYMFRTKILRKIFLQGKLFNNIFIEIVRDSDGKTKDLNILDTSDIDVGTNANGDAQRYEGKTVNPVTGDKPTWTPKEITWIKVGDRTQGWAPVDMRALWENLHMKYYVNRYVAWLWKTGQYRLMFNFNKASNQDIEDFITYAKRNNEDFEVPFIAKGDLKTSLLRDMREISSIVELLKHLDSQTLILLRVPPIDAGIPDASGRSNADAQANNIESSVVSLKKLVQDYINFDLFPKINKGTVTLEFGPMNRFAVKQILGMIKELNDMGFSEEAIQEFINDRGIYFEANKLFKEKQLDPISAQFQSEEGAPKQEAPPGKDFGVKNQPQEEITTREDQLKKT